MTFFSGVSVAGSCRQKPFSRNRAEPVPGTRDGKKTWNARSKPAFWLTSQPPFYMQRRHPCQE